MSESNTYSLIQKLAKREKLEETKIIELFSLAIQEIYQEGDEKKDKLHLFFDSEKKEFCSYQSAKKDSQVKQAENLDQLTFNYKDLIIDRERDSSTVCKLTESLKEKIQKLLDFNGEIYAIEFYEFTPSKYESYIIAKDKLRNRLDLVSGVISLGVGDFEIQKSDRSKLIVPLDLKKLVNYDKVLERFYLLLERAQKERTCQEFSSLQGKLVEGTIQEKHKQYYLVKLGAGRIGYYPDSEWLPNENIWVGKQLRFLLKEVSEENKQSVILNRKENLFLQKLLETEVPEMAKKEIFIQDILRMPGIMSKIIVKSNNSYLNILGSCIGKNRSRITNIIKDMGKEKIDFVLWSEDMNRLITNLFSPVKIISLLWKKTTDKKTKLIEKHLTIIVPQDKLSLVLGKMGKRGQEQISEVELISNYLNVKIHIKGLEDLKKQNTIILWNGNVNFENYQETISSSSYDKK